MKVIFGVMLPILILASQVSARTLVETRKVYTKEASNGLEMRKSRRFGVGLQGAGNLGIGGAVLDLAFTPQWSFAAGFGGGEGFQAFMLQAKYVLAGDWLMPYFAFGYTNWSSIGQGRGPIGKTTPGLLYDKLLNSDERASGEYRKNLIYPAFGLQFMQLNGEWAGFSVYAEFVALLDIGGFTAAPTGSLGVLYYF